MGDTLEEIGEENRLLREQIELLQQTLLLQQAQQEEAEEEQFLLVRSNITGYTTIIHPDMRFRGKGGDVAISPFSEVILPAEWKNSPNIWKSAHAEVVTVTELSESELPERLVTMPELDLDDSQMDPIHRRIARDFALLGADSDEGTVLSYPQPVRMLLDSDLRTPGGTSVDIGYMQDVVRPVLELALRLERGWRNRAWVIQKLEDRILQIVNLTRRRT